MIKWQISQAKMKANEFIQNRLNNYTMKKYNFFLLNTFFANFATEKMVKTNEYKDW